MARDTRAHALEGNWRGRRCSASYPGTAAATAVTSSTSASCSFRGCRGSMFQLEEKSRLSPGDEVAIGRYRVEYRGGDIEQGPNYVATVANLTVSEEGGTPLVPSQRDAARRDRSDDERGRDLVADLRGFLRDSGDLRPGVGDRRHHADRQPDADVDLDRGGVMVLGTRSRTSPPRSRVPPRRGARAGGSGRSRDRDRAPPLAGGPVDSCSLRRRVAAVHAAQATRLPRRRSSARISRPKARLCRRFTSSSWTTRPESSRTTTTGRSRGGLREGGRGHAADRRPGAKTRQIEVSGDRYRGSEVRMTR